MTTTNADAPGSRAALLAVHRRLLHGEPVRVLSLHQPWASAIARGHKRIETRSWPTTWRGLVAIHATRKGRENVRAHVQHDEALSRRLGMGPLQDLPKGALVALVEVLDCEGTRNAPMWPSAIREALTEQERELGDFSVGRYAWFLRLHACIESAAIAHAGRQGLTALGEEKTLLLTRVIGTYYDGGRGGAT